LPNIRIETNTSGWTVTESSFRFSPDIEQPINTYVEGAYSAFKTYTFGGPVELMAGKSIGQAGVLTLGGVYATLRTGVAIELAMDFAILGGVLTFFDPANHWEGGLDELGFMGGTQEFQGYPNPAMYGLSKGPLGRLVLRILGVEEQ
jgi:hypothetical protein